MTSHTTEQQQQQQHHNVSTTISEHLQPPTTTSYPLSSKEALHELNIESYEYRNQLIIASEYARNIIGTASIAIVLGSGLGGFEAMLHNKKELPYEQIPFLPLPTVKGHSGKMIVGDVKSSDGKKSRRILCFSGRSHAYEGYPMYQVTFCTRLSYLLGCHTMILTNSSGGCIPNQKPGSVVVVTDFIREVEYNILSHSSSDAMFGVRHPRGDHLLDPDLISLFIKVAEEVNFPHYLGSYWWSSGPVYETAAQIRFVMNCGGAAVGMSTVPEILAAANLGMRVAALSLSTNVAAGLSEEVLSHELVVANAKMAAESFGNYVSKSLLEIEDPKPDYVHPTQKWRHSIQDLTQMTPLITDTSKFTKLHREYFYPLSPDLFSCHSDVYPYHDLLRYKDLYTDIKHVRNILTKVLDFEDSSSSTSSKRVKISNRNGPIPVWAVHEPFRFDVGKWLDCPLSFPLNRLKGFRTIAYSTSSNRAILTFGLSRNALVILLANLHLDGLRYDEYNYIVNLLHGVIGHSNLYFMNLFMAFDTHRIYGTPDTTLKTKTLNKEKEEKDKEEKKQSEPSSKVSMHTFALLHDYMDFHGGIPRYPFPSSITKRDDTQSEVKRDSGDHSDACFDYSRGKIDPESKGFTTMASHISEINGGKIETHGYAWWPGPQLPSRAELTISEKAHCALVGVTNPELPTIARQLGHEGYNVVFIADNEDLDHISSMDMLQESNHDAYDASLFVKQISHEIIGKASNTEKTSLIKVSQLETLKDLDFPNNIPAYQIFYDINVEWDAITHAHEWLLKQWNFKDEKKHVEHLLFSQFAHPFVYHQEHKNVELFSINLSQIPGFAKHFCGGVGYTHFHYQNDNPFDWTLKIFQNKQNNKKNYAVIAPQWIIQKDSENLLKQLHGDKKEVLSSKKSKSDHDALEEFYKYSPVMWNLHFFLRVLWKCGAKNVAFLTNLFGTDNTKFSLQENSVVLVNNFVDTTRWNCLTGQNDERLGPRFVPITDPMDGNKELGTIAASKEYGSVTLRDVQVVHTTPHGLISPLCKKFYSSMGLVTLVNGLIPCIHTAQHLNMKKSVLGIVDYDSKKPLHDLKSFDSIMKLIETSFI